MKIKLTKDKETPGTWRYKEEPDADEHVVIGSLYVKRWAVKEMGRPTTITVTIEAS